MKKLIFCLSLILVIACKQKQITSAKIIERKSVENKVLIKYSFILNDQLVVDSEIVANNVIPHDSVQLLIQGKNHQLLLP